MKRFPREFLDPWTIKKLFFTFVIPILEYGSQIWNTYYIDQTKRIESVQKQFLLYALRRLNWPDNCHIPKYEHRLLLLQMSTLEDRRKIAQSIFILRLIKGEIDSKVLLDEIHIRIPTHNIRE